MQYAEKLVLLSQAASAITPALPSIPPSNDRPYEGAQTTASVRASMQQALDQYKPNSLNLVLAQASAADLQRSDTRSFGETHAKELSRITETTHSSVPVTPPRSASPGLSTGHTHHPVVVKPKPVPVPGSAKPSTTSGLASSPPFGSQPPPLDPSKLNQSPSKIPIPAEVKGKGPAVPAPVVSDAAAKVPPEPTVAETGIPKSAGPGGPGPISGSLLTIHSEDKAPQTSPVPPPTQTPTPPVTQSEPAGVPPVYGGATQQYESAEDEKKKLQRKEQESLLAGDSPGAGAPPPPPHEGTPATEAKKFESAEEEKRRLEREEREKLLSSGGSVPGPKEHDDNNPPPDSELPPYEEY